MSAALSGSYGGGLFDQHQQLLAASAVSPEVARERGYVSVDTKKRLADLGFEHYQQRTPGLLIPVWNELGALALHVYRPDQPRTDSDGKPRKYEMPAGARMELDVPPRARSKLGDPVEPLWVTEGSRKADAAVTAGLCCVALLGVWNWRGTNNKGGSTALAAWEAVALKGRWVFIAFDSDVMTKQAVRRSLERLGEFLARRGARVGYVYLPAGPGGAKVGLDDYLAGGGEVEPLIEGASDQPREPTLPLGEVATETTQYTEPQPRAGHSVDSGDSVTTSAPPAWEAPAPLRAVPELPSFPVDALPDWLAAYVKAEATATQTPVDLPGMLALDTLATAAGGLARVQVRLGFQEPLNLFTVAALPPGARKSAVFADMTRPLATFDRDEARRMQAVILQEVTARKVAERAAEQAEAAAGKATGQNRDRLLAEAVDAAARAAAIHVPPTPRMLADDATPEALASLLAEHGRIALLSPEGGVFEMMAGRYQTGGPNLDVYLKGHAGDALRVDRKGRPAEFVDRPALTIGLAVQPEVLRALRDRPGLRGRGLPARFLYALPPNTVGRRQVGASPVPAEVADRYRTNLQALCRSLLDEREAAQLLDPDGLLVLVLDGEAEAALRAFEAELEPRLDPDGGDLGHVADWASKLVGATARIAGLLHLAEHLRDGWGNPVGVAQVRAAISIARYLIDHALAAFDLMGSDPTLDDARYLLRWIERTGPERFTRRDLHVALPRGRFPKVDALDAPLALLEAHGYVRKEEAEPRPGPGRPPSPTYTVNPGLTKKEERRLTR
jgi:replicative DNA helicase